MDGGLLATLLCFCAHSWNSMRFRPQCLDYHGEATSLLRDAASENVSTIWIHKPPEEEDRSDCDCNDAESEIESVSVGASNFDRSSRDMERANEPKQHRGCISTGEAAIAVRQTWKYFSWKHQCHQLLTLFWSCTSIKRQRMMTMKTCSIMTTLKWHNQKVKGRTNRYR
jgi:hypothetical protein